MAAVPSIGRADRASRPAAPEADLTRALYEKYANQIFRYCVHQLGSREEAEDAVQSTFLNAFRGIKRGVVPELESAWLFKIAENVCLSRRRSSWRRDRIESPADFDVVEEVTPAPGRLADELIGLQDVLAQMPESQRRAILLREWQGLSYREIAGELELSQSAVETLIFRARRSLAQGLEQPPEPVAKRRLVRGADWGNVLAGLKSILLGGGAAAKVAAAVAVVSASTVVVAAPVQHHTRPPHLPAAPAPASVPKTSTHAPVAPIAAAPEHAAPAPRSTHPRRVVHAPAASGPPASATPAAGPAPTLDVSSPATDSPAAEQPAAEQPATAPAGGTPAVTPPAAKASSSPPVDGGKTAGTSAGGGSAPPHGSGSQVQDQGRGQGGRLGQSSSQAQTSGQAQGGWQGQGQAGGQASSQTQARDQGGGPLPPAQATAPAESGGSPGAGDQGISRGQSADGNRGPGGVGDHVGSGVTTARGAAMVTATEFE